MERVRSNMENKMQTVVENSGKHYLIKTDPLPIGGFETRVMACNQYGWVDHMYCAKILDIFRSLTEKQATRAHNQMCRKWTD